MESKRPVNLQLTTMKFPPMAIASILHRLSGVILFLAIPLLLYMLDYSLRNEDVFLKLKQCLQAWPMKLLLWVVLAALLYHLIAGVRHLIMDMGWGESLTAGRRSALSVFVLAAISVVFIGIWLW
ncbi:MAG: succinate dehydrogenase, cytochrome b556 subunit [Gammaproteobacteria bacterium]